MMESLYRFLPRHKCGKIAAARVPVTKLFLRRGIYIEHPYSEKRHRSESPILPCSS